MVFVYTNHPTQHFIVDAQVLFGSLCSAFYPRWLCAVQLLQNGQRWRWGNVLSYSHPAQLSTYWHMMVVLLMEEILHLLGFFKPCKSWYKLPTSTGERRISSINSIMVVVEENAPPKKNNPEVAQSRYEMSYLSEVATTVVVCFRNPPNIRWNDCNLVQGIGEAILF